MDAATDIVASTRSYEQWVRRQIEIVPQDLKRKHERMAESAFVLLRGTFYRWVQLWPALCSTLVNAPSLPCVGDLHVENFGTWRDREGRLVWGVNDIDEACRLPYTNDLVRLATSAALAIGAGHFTLGVRESCDVILDGYAASLDHGGEAFVLEERHRWLRKIAQNELRDPKIFWSKLEDLPRATGVVPQAVFKAVMPATDGPYRIVSRVAGVGSLGRRRLVALGVHHGALVAREAKAWLPSAAVWAMHRPSAGVDGISLLDDAVRSYDPCYTKMQGWFVRRLAPDCSRIELGDLPRERDEVRLLRAMGWETANLHAGRARTRIRTDLKKRPRRWLETAAVAMAEAVTNDWREWRRRAG